jgi:hypothetical protein
MKKLQHFFFAFLTLIMSGACDEHGDPQGRIDLNEQQIASVSMRGKWGLASDASLPFGTTPGVLDDLTIEFRIDDDYNPGKFSAVGAPYFFMGEEGTWVWADDAQTTISLGNILPVTHVNIMKEGHAIRLTFTYEGPGGGRTSKVGDYGITLKKIAP